MITVARGQVRVKRKLYNGDKIIEEEEGEKEEGTLVTHSEKALLIAFILSSFSASAANQQPLRKGSRGLKMNSAAAAVLLQHTHTNAKLSKPLRKWGNHHEVDEWLTA